MNKHGLNPRQIEVLAMLGEATSRKMIAGVLNISGKTVDYHIGKIEKALHLSGDKALVKFAVDNGLTYRAPAQVLPATTVSNMGQLEGALLRTCEAAANGTSNPAQANVLCQCSQTLIELYRFKMELNFKRNVDL